MKFILLFFLVTFIACNSKHEIKNNLVTLPEPKIILPEELLYDFEMSPPFEIKTFGDYLFFTQPMIGKPILFYNRKTTQHNFSGNSGSGPDDFISASCIYHNDKDSIIKLYDMNLRKMVEFKLFPQGNSVSLIPKKRYRIQTDSISLFGLHEMENGFFVSLAALGSKNMFVLLDKNLEVHSTFGSKPIKEMPDANYIYLYGRFASSGNKLYFATQTTGYLVCYDISNKGVIRKDWEASFTNPNFETNPFRWKRENKQGFSDIQVNDKYIFLAFSGKSFEDEELLPKSIVILNHKGDVKRHLMYDKEYLLGRFTLTGDSIYAIGRDRITRFNWKNELKKL